MSQLTPHAPESRKAIFPAIAAIALIAGFGCQPLPIAASPKFTLNQARAGFTTSLVTKTKDNDPLVKPPAGSGLKLVYYKDPLGKFPAYVSLPKTAGKRYPAIIWIIGGFDSSIDDSCWTRGTPDNDQSAMGFRDRGIITMYPSRRGGNNNPGYHEICYGEVDDVIAAEKYLKTLPYVDPNRIYLGGHSTGGTLALLTSESTSAFRAVFCLGPVASVVNYGTDVLTYDHSNRMEDVVRCPAIFLDSVTTPTWIIEGTSEPSNITSLNFMQKRNTNPLVHFMPVEGQDHFSEISATTPQICTWILHDKGTKFKGPDAK